MRSSTPTTFEAYHESGCKTTRLAGFLGRFRVSNELHFRPEVGKQRPGGEFVVTAGSRTETVVHRQFLERVTAYLVSLPYDLRVLHEAVSSPDLDRAARELAAGTVMYVLLPNDTLIDERPGIGFVDDVVLVRAALRRIRDGGGDAAPLFAARFPEYFDALDADLQLFWAALGADIYGWLEGKLDGVAKLQYKGKRASQVVDDEDAIAFLYEEGLAFQTDYEITEELLDGRLRRVGPILDALERRRGDEARRIS